MPYKRPASTEERIACLTLAQFYGVTMNAIDKLEKRMDADTKTVMTATAERLHELLCDIMDTFPQGTRETVIRTAKNTNMAISAKQYGKLDDDFICIKTSDMTAMLQAATQAECAICMKRGEEMRKCPIRRMLRDYTDKTQSSRYGQCAYVGLRLEQ